MATEKQSLVAGVNYPLETVWTFHQRRYTGRQEEARLALYWEADLDPVSDDYLPDEITAGELWALWRARVDGYLGRGGAPPGAVRLWWFVDAGFTFEGCPFCPSTARGQFPDHPNFLTYFTWPTNADTGEPVQWSRLPVADKLWRPGRADKGGFIQEATGWKPSALQPWMVPDLLAAAAGLTR